VVDADKLVCVDDGGIETGGSMNAVDDADVVVDTAVPGGIMKGD
jgi:hypothetical protein